MLPNSPFPSPPSSLVAHPSSPHSGPTSIFAAPGTCQERSHPRAFALACLSARMLFPREQATQDWLLCLLQVSAQISLPLKYLSEALPTAVYPHSQITCLHSTQNNLASYHPSFCGSCIVCLQSCVHCHLCNASRGAWHIGSMPQTLIHVYCSDPRRGEDKEGARRRHPWSVHLPDGTATGLVSGKAGQLQVLGLGQHWSTPHHLRPPSAVSLLLVTVHCACEDRWWPRAG